MKRQQRSHSRRNQDRDFAWGRLISKIAQNARGSFRRHQEELAAITAALRPRHRSFVADREACDYTKNLLIVIEALPSPHRLQTAMAVLAAVVEEAFDAFVRSGPITGYIKASPIADE